MRSLRKVGKMEIILVVAYIIMSIVGFKSPVERREYIVEVRRGSCWNRHIPIGFKSACLTVSLFSSKREASELLLWYIVWVNS